MKFCNACGRGNPQDVSVCERCGAEFGAGGSAEGGLGPGSFVGGDRYEILSHLGQGGMGSVYKAQNPRLGKQVAVKLLNQDLLANSQARVRMEREARAMARIDHPNVVEIYDVLDHESSLALVLEYVGGGSLSDRIQRGALPWREGVTLVIDVLNGLDALHAASLVHRDLKPDNILIDAKSGLPKITDLGVAHDAKGRQVTRHGAQLGTPEYMSPEQVRGTTVDARSDLYAVGIVLYEVLTGEVPFSGESEFDIKRDQVERAPDLSRLPPEVPPAVTATLARALDKAPEQRQASAQEMRDALAAALDNPTAAPPIAQLQRPQAPSRPQQGPGAAPPAPAGGGAPATSPNVSAAPASHGLFVLAGAILLGSALVAIAIVSGDDSPSETSTVSEREPSSADPMCRSSRDCGPDKVCIADQCEGEAEPEARRVEGVGERAATPTFARSDDELEEDNDEDRMQARARSEEPVGRAKEHYRTLMRAYNQRDREGYYALFTEGEFCFYNTTKEVHRFVNGRDKRFRRYQFGRKPGSATPPHRMEIRSLKELLNIDGQTVLLWDRGTWTAPSRPVKNPGQPATVHHNKIIHMELTPTDDWVFAGEASMGAYECMAPLINQVDPSLLQRIRQATQEDRAIDCYAGYPKSCD